MQLDLEQISQFIEEGVPFNVNLGLTVQTLEKGRAIIRMPFKDHLVGDPFRPALHGGAVAALIDATAGAAAFAGAAATDRISTLDIRIDYLRPAPKRDLLATAEILRIGNRVAVVNVVVLPDGEEEPVAEGRVVFSIWRDVGLPESVKQSGLG